MRYNDFENVMSVARMSRYLAACQNDSRKAMTLYRQNLRLSQELFTVISCFEIALRNAIDRYVLVNQGNDWLRNAAANGGIFDNRHFRFTARAINDAVSSLGPGYTHSKLVAELGFGFWRYMFAPHQFQALGQTLLQVFPNKPSSTPLLQYNRRYVFDRLKEINDLRNRIAHHEPVCFQLGQPVINTTYAREHYQTCLLLFNWLGIDEKGLLYGLDHVDDTIRKIDNL